MGANTENIQEIIEQSKVIEENANISSFKIIYSKKRFRTSVAHKNI